MNVWLIEWTKRCINNPVNGTQHNQGSYLVHLPQNIQTVDIVMLVHVQQCMCMQSICLQNVACLHG